MSTDEMSRLLAKWCEKLRITPDWDVCLREVTDGDWKKTGDIKIDCDDKKAIVLINVLNPKQENIEEVIVHELFHLKMYPLDQVTESLIESCFEANTPGQNFAYAQFFVALEQTVEELTKCFLAEGGENRDLSFGRCAGKSSFGDLYNGLKPLK